MKKNKIVMDTKSGLKKSILLFLIFILSTTLAYSQNERFTFNVEKIQLRDLLDKIEKQSNYKFLYRSDAVKNQYVKIQTKNASLGEVLNHALDKTNLTYKILDDNLIVIASKETIESNQKQKISGNITDAQTRETIIGVSVFVKGLNTGVITDISGKFNLEVPIGSVLTISYIGYRTQNVLVTNEKVLNIELSQDTKNLDEVVVVGYGTQKKVNLTGSVASVSSAELENRPITQASQALSGLATGVQVMQGSGSPGNDGATITIRGIGTFGAGRAALVLVDGLEASINDVDPDNIKSISVLKDAASASIYGTRAANGVILIETKSGQKGKLQVSYSNYFGLQQVTELPQFVDSWQYASLTGATADIVAKYKAGTDLNNYPNVSHLKNLLTSGSGQQTSHNLSFTGGDGNNSYLFSLGYLNQEGIVAKNDYEKYNFMLNLDSKIKENLTLKVNLSGYTSTTTAPNSSNGYIQNIIGFAVREPNTYAGLKSDGTYGHQDSYSPEGWLASPSFANNLNKYFISGVELSWQILKGLTLSEKIGYKYYNYKNTNFVASVVFDPNTTIGPNNLSVSTGDGSLITLQSLVQYEKTINKHTFNALAGFSQEADQDDWISGYRDNFPNNLLYQLNAGAATNMQASGSDSEWALRSYFGRLNYSYDGKYLFEANARYDGSSRFPENNRWGFFPSFSAGWRISEESFIKENLTWVDNLKLRASWGILGNQNISNYPYQNAISLGQNYTFGGTLAPGASVTTLANTAIKWETTQVTDIGLDLDIFKGKLSMTLDYFDKNTSGILYIVPVSAVLGLNPSEVNAGGMRNTGYEVMLKYNTSIGKVNIGVSPNFSYVDSRVTKIAGNIQEDIGAGLFVGQSLNPIYGYIADGIFKNAADVANYPTQPIPGQPGVIRFKDISGPNGVPDGKVDAYDKTMIGNTTPKYSFGANITANYKGFDFSLLLQGLGGFVEQMGSYQAFAFYNSGNIQQWQVSNAWTVSNPNPNAKYPAITNLSQGSENVQTSTFWNRDASFLRVKNLQIGYSFSNSLIQKLGITKLRIYAGGQNLFSFNHFYTGWDPEMYQASGDSPNFYPITSVYMAGLNVKF